MAKMKASVVITLPTFCFVERAITFLEKLFNFNTSYHQDATLVLTDCPWSETIFIVRSYPLSNIEKWRWHRCPYCDSFNFHSIVSKFSDANKSRFLKPFSLLRFYTEIICWKSFKIIEHWLIQVEPFSNGSIKKVKSNLNFVISSGPKIWSNFY